MSGLSAAQDGLLQPGLRPAALPTMAATLILAGRPKALPAPVNGPSWGPIWPVKALPVGGRPGGGLTADAAAHPCWA